MVIFDASNPQKVIAPGGSSGIVKVAGVLVDVMGSSGTVSGDYVNVQRTGRCPVLLKAGQLATFGDKLQVAGTDGSVAGLSTSDSVDIVGIAMQTLTAGSNNDLIDVQLQIQFTGDTVP